MVRNLLWTLAGEVDWIEHLTDGFLLNVYRRGKARGLPSILHSCRTLKATGNTGGVAPSDAMYIAYAPSLGLYVCVY